MNLFYLLCLGRTGTCLGTMVFAGALPVIRSEWNIDATEAGSIQAVFSISNACALLFASWFSDHTGARKMYILFSWAGVISLVMFAFFVDSYSSALFFMIFVGLAQGGGYTPAMMLAMDMNSLSRRGYAVGMILAAGSFGYLISVFVASFSASVWGASAAFWLCAAGTLAGAASSTLALSGQDRHFTPAANRRHSSAKINYSIPAVLLLTGYIAHCWELLGSWAWTPSMVMQSLQGYSFNPITSGLIVACAVHLSGMFSTLIVGAVSDFFNRTSVLIVIGAAGALSSGLMGYSASWGTGWVLMLTFVGSFFIIGDSGVLSAAIADNVPQATLGRVMGIRSLLGFGIGSLAPLSFGNIMDRTHSWEMGYLVLAAGGAIACLTAMLLRVKR